MGFYFQRRPVQAGGLRNAAGGGPLATTKGLALTTSWSTAASITIQAFFKTSGTIIPGRVVKLSSAGNIRHTTGTSGRRVVAVALTSASTALVGFHGIFFLQASSGAIKRGSALVPSSGSIQTSRFNGGCVKVASVAVGTSVAHQQACGFALTSAAASSASVRKVLAYFNSMGRISTGL